MRLNISLDDIDFIEDNRELQKRNLLRFKENEKGLINEETRMDILRGADDTRLKKSNSLVCYFLGVSDSKGWLRFKVMSQTVPGKYYTVYIKLKDAKDIKYFKDFKKRDIVRLLLNGNLSLFCSCKDFRYRHKYQAYQLGYGLFKEIRYPHIANPKLVGTTCKHCLVVLKYLNLQWLAISKAMQASKFFKNKYEDNNVNTRSKNKKSSSVLMPNRGRRVKGTS